MLKSNGGHAVRSSIRGFLRIVPRTCLPYAVLWPSYSEHVSFSYVDLLTKVVEIAFTDEELEQLLQQDNYKPWKMNRAFEAALRRARN